MENKKTWEVVEEAVNSIQAELIRGLLEAQGVTAMISQEGYQRAMGLMGTNDAMLEILVPNDQVEDAKKILSDYYAGNLESGGADAQLS